MTGAAARPLGPFWSNPDDDRGSRSLGGALSLPLLLDHPLGRAHLPGCQDIVVHWTHAPRLPLSEEVLTILCDGDGRQGVRTKRFFSSSLKESSLVTERRPFPAAGTCYRVMSLFQNSTTLSDGSPPCGGGGRVPGHLLSKAALTP